MARIFIDGREGTTGLRIYERIASRSDIEVTVLSDEQRKLPEYRAQALNSCDIAFLCLPDAAAREAVEMITDPKVRVIDASTAHRCLPDWAYGFPELSDEHREKIASSNRVCVPGCHASGFISLIYPLIAEGVLDPNAHIACHSLTGYSGGGKKMIAQYEQEERDALLDAPRLYSMLGQHKHLPEMSMRTGLVNKPSFCPIVDDFYSGMLVTVQLFRHQLIGADAERIKDIYRRRYNGNIVNYVDFDLFNENGFASAGGMSRRDGMQITVAGSEDNILLMSRFDNLGKGASGAAIQCMNIMLGLDETVGLEL